MLTGETAIDPLWAPLMPESLGEDLGRARFGDEIASNRITLAFARIVALDHPTFFHDGFGLTTWEARVDRGIGMLMRPPSRLFVDAGLERRQVEAMPIRLDLQGGLMGGAWIPPRLIGNLRELLDARLDRLAKRLHEAEYDPYALLGLMDIAVAYAAERNLGLFEAIGVVGPSGEYPAGVEIVFADQKRMNPALLQRIELAITPPKKPGLFSRMLGRKQIASNGHVSDDVI
jgi:hypothetical protein